MVVSAFIKGEVVFRAGMSQLESQWPDVHQGINTWDQCAALHMVGTCHKKGQEAPTPGIALEGKVWNYAARDSPQDVGRDAAGRAVEHGA